MLLCIHCCYVKTKQQRPLWLRGPSAWFSSVLDNGYEMIPSGQGLSEHTIAVAVHLSEKTSVYTKQSLNAHKSLGTCDYVLCAGKTVSLGILNILHSSIEICAVYHTSLCCSDYNLCAILCTCTSILLQHCKSLYEF